MRKTFYYDKKGYPRSRKDGELLHKKIVEKMLGRKLEKHEVVHHRDEDKHNFKKENLWVMSRSKHSKIHKRGRIIRKAQEKKNET